MGKRQRLLAQEAAAPSQGKRLSATARMVRGSLLLVTRCRISSDRHS